MGKTIGLGDVVRFAGNDGYDDHTVCQVNKDGSVDLFRPYVHTADFSMCGSEEGSSAVICYVGVSTVKHVDPKVLKLIRKLSLPLK